MMFAKNLQMLIFFLSGCEQGDDEGFEQRRLLSSWNRAFITFTSVMKLTARTIATMSACLLEGSRINNPAAKTQLGLFISPDIQKRLLIFTLVHLTVSS